MNDVALIVSSMLAGAAFALVIGLLVIWYRAQQAPRVVPTPTLQLLPVDVRITHHVELPDELYAAIERAAHGSMVLEIGRETVTDVADAVDASLDRIAARAAVIPPARPLTQPPEPEQRLANDMRHARAIQRGAEQIMQLAKNSGVVIPRNEALAEAAAMYNRTTLTDD